MVKARFQIEWPDGRDDGFMNVWSLLLCLTSKCPDTRFEVTDLDTGEFAEGQRDEEKEVF